VEKIMSNFVFGFVGDLNVSIISICFDFVAGCTTKLALTCSMEICRAFGIAFCAEVAPGLSA